MVLVAALRAIESFQSKGCNLVRLGPQWEGDMKRFFRKYLLSLFACSAFIGLTPFAHANTIALDLNTAALTGGASVIGGPKIKFDAHTLGTATFTTIPSLPGAEYSISVTGHNDASSSFFQFFIDKDGPGPLGFVQLGSNTHFSGFSTITLLTFTDAGTSDSFKIVRINGGTGNSAGQISAVTVTSVPGPALGAGLPGLIFAGGGLLAWWRRKQRAQALA
jgi:hypothetical protein